MRRKISIPEGLYESILKFLQTKRAQEMGFLRPDDVVVKAVRDFLFERRK